MRWAILGAILATTTLATGLGAAPEAYAQSKPGGTGGAADAAEGPASAEIRVTSDLLRATSPTEAGRTYDSVEAALIQGDLDYVVREGRRAIANGQPDSSAIIAVFADDMAAGDPAGAQAVLDGAPGGVNGGLASMLEPFLLAATDRADLGVERVENGADALPAPLPEVARAMIFESAGRFEEAAAVYALMVERLDTTPPGDAEPQNAAEFQRALGATRVAHAVYRAALVHHRLGRVEDARRYYEIVAGFAPRSADVAANLARLNAGQPPLEQPLTPVTATGRWMIFVSEYLTQAEMLSALLSQQPPRQGLPSTNGALLLQAGVLLAGDANDWRVYAAQQALQASGFEGAQRIIDRMPADSLFAPDAEIVRASILLEQRHDDAAMEAAARALAMAGDRWGVIASAGDIYRRAGHADRAIPAFDRALNMAESAEDRADVLGWRAYAHRFAGNISAASTDARAAFAIDQSVNTRLLYVSILMEDPQGWADGITVARGLFAEQPDSVLRLNALGYALIQRPEGLEEGYRLLWRGFNYGQADAAVVDSLGWAYYLYGHFDEARALIERAVELSVNDPNAEILDHLGDVYWRLGRRDDARARWREALEARPETLRRRTLETKVRRGLTEAAPRTRELPRVDLPDAPSPREDL
jgi:tetratricopeptide (TPR) repeat protein